MQSGSEQDRDDSAKTFVGDLRGLRDGLDVPPTWDAMVRRAKARGVRVGKSTLHKIAKLDALPSELAVRGYLAALGIADAEIDRWVARRATMAGPLADQVADDAEFAVEERSARLRGGPGWRWWAAAGAVVLGTNVVTGFVVHRTSALPPSGQSTVQAATGDNPVNTPCLADAEIATSTNKNPQFLLEIVFSAKCRAFWARITRSDERALGNHVEVSLYRRSDPTGSTRQNAVEPDIKGAFTTLIVRDDSSDRLCATGAIVTDGARVVAVEPICT